MAFVITERLLVDAPVDRVWTYLTDPAEVATCMPGAELTGTDPDGSFRGRITVKVGPLTMTYTGSARFEEQDSEHRRARLVASAREAGGGGTAVMTMTSTVAESAEEGTEVSLHASVDLTGRIVQFGRGLLVDVAGQIVRQFASCMQDTLAAETNAFRVAAAAGVTTPPPQTTTGSVKRRPSVEATTMVSGALWRSLLRALRRLFGTR